MKQGFKLFMARFHVETLSGSQKVLAAPFAAETGMLSVFWPGNR
jgi:hypothetical protein